MTKAKIQKVMDDYKASLLKKEPDYIKHLASAAVMFEMCLVEALSGEAGPDFIIKYIKSATK